MHSPSDYQTQGEIVRPRLKTFWIYSKSSLSINERRADKTIRSARLEGGECQPDVGSQKFKRSKCPRRDRSLKKQQSDFSSLCFWHEPIQSDLIENYRLQLIRFIDEPMRNVCCVNKSSTVIIIISGCVMIYEVLRTESVQREICYIIDYESERLNILGGVKNVRKTILFTIR